MKPVLVLDAETDQALAVVRSLSTQKIPVHIAGREKWGPALWSRRSEKRFVYPSPLIFPEKFLQFISDLLTREKYEAVFPATDSSITLLQKIYGDFPSVHFAMAKAESYRKVSDKIFTQDLARKHGLLVPETFYPQSPEELKSIRDRFQFPLVLKPRYSRYYDDRTQKLKTGDTQIVFDYPSLEKLFPGSRQGDAFPCIQEWVEGKGFGVEMLVQRGEAPAIFCHKRIREMNPLGSGSSVCESVPLRSDLVRASLAMLKSCNYEGVAMVEFRVDEKTGKAWFVEINGRFWGSLALPVACGIDFPFLYLESLRGKKVPVPAAPVYPSGIRACSLWKESSRLVSVLKGKPREWNGPFPLKGEALRDYFGSFLRPGQIFCDFQWSDPLPAFAANISFWLKTIFKLFSRCFKV